MSDPEQGVARAGLDAVSDIQISLDEDRQPGIGGRLVEGLGQTVDLAKHAIHELPNTLRHQIGGSVVRIVKDTFTFGTRLEHLNQAKPAFKQPIIEFEEEDVGL